MNLKDADTDGDVNWFRPVFSFWLRSCERVRIQIQKIVEVFALGFVSVVMNKSNQSQSQDLDLDITTVRHKHRREIFSLWLV